MASNLEETVIWTTLPNGVATNGAGAPVLKLSVHVAPRLTTLGGPDTTIGATFAADFGDWPGHAHGFSVVIEDLPGGTDSAPATVTPDIRSSAVWAALFPPSTLVRSLHDVDTFPNVQVISYSPSNVLTLLEKHYTDIALASPGEYPTFDDLSQRLNDIGFGNDAGVAHRRELLAALAAERAQGARANSFSSPSAGRDIVALQEFLQPTSYAGAVPEVAPTLDFHEALSMAGSHGTLMRLLGVVFDLEVPMSAFRIDTTLRAARVSVQPTFASTTLPYHAVTPRSLCSVSRTAFEARATGGTLSGRHQRLGDTALFDVVEVDVDGGGLKASNLATNLQLSRVPGKPGQPDRKTTDTPDRYSLPALREAGLAVVERDRSTSFVESLDTSLALNTAMVGNAVDPASVPPPDLAAQDLVRGNLLDVYDADAAVPAWRSTAGRTGAYHFTGAGAPPDVPVTDEAPFLSPPTSSPDPAAVDPPFHLQQSLARWDGWSLAVSRPGSPIHKNDSTTPPAPGPNDPAQPPSWPIAFQLGVPSGSLPRLRFGHRYALKMRAVDIAGNALPLDGGVPVPDALGRTTPLKRYLRFTPVAAPDLYGRQAPVPGESIARIVIRGNWDSDSPDTAVRLVAPPRASQFLAEAHGAFDAALSQASSPSARAASYGLIASRESKRYDDVYPPPTPIDPTAPVPYLPDPLAKGAAFKLVAGVEGALLGSVVPLGFGPGGWPDATPFELALHHGAAQAFLPQPGERRLDVTLTKADVVRVRLSSTFDTGDLALFGIDGWVKARGASLNDLDAAAGQQWLFTPYREVMLIYAVRQPLAEPTLTPFVSRQVGDTFAFVRGTVDHSHKSTGRLELRGTWTEPVDGGPGAPAPAQKTTEALAFPIEATSDHEQFGGRHEFGDTKHRDVGYWSLATSRFTEHFAASVADLAVTAFGTPLPLPAPLGVEPGSVQVRLHDDGTRVAEGVAYTVDPAGAVTFVAGPATTGHVPPGAHVDIDFLPPVSRPTPPTAQKVVLDIPSSARPRIPEVEYVLPAFAWSRQAPAPSAGTIKSQRRSGRLRIYLRRPWWSSGDGELLGVVTWPGAEAASASASLASAQGLVTQWGHDPVFAGASLPHLHPRLASFPLADPADRATNLLVDERAGMHVNVAGHAVGGFDPARDLWWCDVDVETGSAYTPFVRLALARFQPHSLAGVELSRIVLADFMQLAPDRFVSIVRKSARELSSVTLSGPSYTKASGRKGQGVAELTLERRDERVRDKTLGWVPVGSPTSLAPIHARVGAAWRHGPLTLPEGKLRLVVEQFEVLRTDRRSKRGFGIPTARRLIFSDTIPL